MCVFFFANCTCVGALVGLCFAVFHLRLSCVLMYMCVYVCMFVFLYVCCMYVYVCMYVWPPDGHRRNGLNGVKPKKPV